MMKSGHIDSFAYDYIEPPGEKLRVVAAARAPAAQLANAKRRRKPSGHKGTQRSGGGGGQADFAYDRDSDDFDGGDEYDSLEESGGEAAKSAPPTAQTVVIRKPYWDSYDAVNQLYLEMGECIDRKPRCVAKSNTIFV